MTDCSNAEIRDLLPDYVHDQLSVTDLARVQQHLVSCADCAEELELLQTVFAMRPSVPAINTASIIASLPKPGQHAAFTLQGANEASDSSVRSIASAKSISRKTSTFRNWRAAAAIAVITVGGLSVAIARDGLTGVRGSAPISDTTGMGVALVSGMQTPARGANDSAATAAKDAKVSLSVGDLSDYSDDELEAIMARLDKWDGSASTDPLPGVPILPPGS